MKEIIVYFYNKLKFFIKNLFCKEKVHYFEKVRIKYRTENQNILYIQNREYEKQNFEMPKFIIFFSLLSFVI